MKIRQLFSLLFALACAMFAGSANAQTGYTYFVHGVPGRDLSSDFNPVLPLDVSFNGSCLLRGWSFGEIKGPYSYPAGYYPVSVSLANTMAPCSNPPIYASNLPVLAGQSSFAVAAVTPSNAFTGYFFTADLSATGTGNTRVFVANASAVPYITAGFGPASLDFIGDGSSSAAVAPAGTYSGSIFVAGTTTPVFGPVDETFGSQAVTGFFVVGSATSGSLQILRKTIPNVF
jgi:hypothetical protein